MPILMNNPTVTDMWLLLNTNRKSYMGIALDLMGTITSNEHRITLIGHVQSYSMRIFCKGPSG